ncbi:Silent information regulator protein Sir2 [Desulforamulus reducens MI-1]|uniref:protein acetyllysine N-acetyltransferase n=1 Tax=Desulforamulus reducens (strain ATCC BAA-1160 / DSM 100696 / MI-1) TaxID=349161 RepID=A4J646_DESRM|nr:NAD-dependent deacylase [Desulforamulus reducens]ABO50549.1 Silent information regulator protein Sir2 [Desulforamulus reducens MI-1]
MNYQNRLQQLTELIKKAGKTIALTGAGISTESGIPDFRSKNTGLWNQYDPQEVASIQALKKNPESFYALNFQWWDVCLKAKPNNAHFALARLEKMGWLLGVITQNIDGLHQHAGSKRVWEVHGNLKGCSCLSCKKQFDMGQLHKQLRCPFCGGLLRPDVVLFGDAMPEDFFMAEKVMSGCQLLLVIGSSLQVYPVASLPQLSSKTVIINKEPTTWDKHSDVVFHEPASQVLCDLVDSLNNLQGPFYTGGDKTIHKI